MEIRNLRYFLAVAREENMTRAANLLHVTQPTLSKRLKSLEEEIGKKLFVRRSFSMQLTEEGILLRDRAADLVELSDKIISEFATLDDSYSKDIYLGLAESYQISYLAAEIRRLKDIYPELRYHITSGDTEQVVERLDKGLIDFAVLAEKPDTAKYSCLKFPKEDVWGVIMRSDDPLSEKEKIEVDDLIGRSLFCSDQSWANDIPRWAQKKFPLLRQDGSFRLAYNGSIFAKEGLGYLLSFDRLVDVSENSGLCFRPLSPELTTPLYLVWRKQPVFSPVSEMLVELLSESFSNA
ncbi:MAG: LysR family transcriptional regulator [Oscillospiraceae bacterium]|nr:LysR family transcriptional regulator [Oscillospiraceae bacterium]